MNDGVDRKIWLLVQAGEIEITGGRWVVVQGGWPAAELASKLNFLLNSLMMQALDRRIEVELVTKRSSDVFCVLCWRFWIFVWCAQPAVISFVPVKCIGLLEQCFHRSSLVFRLYFEYNSSAARIQRLEDLADRFLIPKVLEFGNEDKDRHGSFDPKSYFQRVYPFHILKP